MSAPMTSLYVGTDVGGTNTDCAVLANQVVIGRHKAVTTLDITTGVKQATAAALLDAKEKCPNGVVKQVNIGTTHFVNAVVQRQGLTKVSVVRLCGPSTRSIPPFSDFPNDLVKSLNGSVHYLSGGFHIDGRDVTELDCEEVKRVSDQIHQSGIRNVVVVGVFSPVFSSHEKQVGQIIKSRYADMSVTLSDDIGQLGMIQRENASILNECLKPLAKRTIAGMRQALQELGLTCPCYLTQNNGAIISAEMAMEFPVRTFASGPTNSMRGAAFLSHEKDAIVLDIGGTTTDCGMLVNGFPRLSAKHTDVGGVVINQKMIDVFSAGLGGGSLVKKSRSCDGSVKVEVGPKSVGFRLQTESLVFGGTTVTTTDIAVSKGMANDIGQKRLVEHLSVEFRNDAMACIHNIIEDCVDRIKISDEDVPLLLTGGGSILVDMSRPIRGTSRVIRPAHYDVANAIGACLCKVSGEVDYTRSLLSMVDNDKLNDIKCDDKMKNQLLDEARDSAMEEAVDNAKREAQEAGADISTLEIISKSDEPLTYMPGNVTRLRVKVVGDLALSRDSQGTELNKICDKLTAYLSLPQKEEEVVFSVKSGPQPTIDASTGEWLLNESDVEYIALGAAVLGSGGGGNNYIGKLMVRNKLREGKRIRVVTPQRFYKDHDPEKDLALTVCYMGAPLVMYEKLPCGKSSSYAIDTILDLYQSGRYDDQSGTFNNENDGSYTIETNADVSYIEKYRSKSKRSQTMALSSKRKVAALFSVEVGGLNSLEPLLTGAELDLPVLDCDGMGRAFPQVEMASPHIYGVLPYPFIITNEHGRRDVILWAQKPSSLENYCRKVCMSLGGCISCAMRPMTGHEILTKCVQHSLSRAWRIGAAIRAAKRQHRRPVDGIFEVENGSVIIVGKIKDTKRDTVGGFNRGHIIIEGLDKDHGRQVKVEFQNENLAAFDTTNGQRKLLAIVPDLITLIETDTGEAVLTEEVCYGLRVTVLSLVCSPLMSTETALKYVGPAAFGYNDVEYTAVAEYRQNTPVPPIE